MAAGHGYQDMELAEAKAPYLGDVHNRAAVYSQKPGSIELAGHMAQAPCHRDQGGLCRTENGGVVAVAFQQDYPPAIHFDIIGE